MSRLSRAPTSYSTSGPSSSSYPSYTYGYQENTTTTSRPVTRGTGAVRPSTARPRTGASTVARVERQEVICAVAESRGISPTVGLAFFNLDTAEVVLCQICDSQTYVKTLHKLQVCGPTEILVMNTAASPQSKLYSIIRESAEEIGSRLQIVDRKYWSENAGMDYIQDLAFTDDVEAIKLSVTGSFYAVCCMAAVMKYTDLSLGQTVTAHSLRIKYEPSQGSMMIDVSTIHSLELVQNLHKSKSRDCLFGLLNETQTPMGARILRSNLLQPLTDVDTIKKRYDAVDELQTKEDMFFSTRNALKNFLDVDKILTALIIVPSKPTLQASEQSINQIIMLKTFVSSVTPIYEALTGARTPMLNDIREFCAPENVAPILELLAEAINDDVRYAKQPVELRNQRVYAVKSGVNGLLDVARQTYKENQGDAYLYVTELGEHHNINTTIKYEASRGYFIQIPKSDLEQFERRILPPVFTNIVKRKNYIECQTVELMKWNQKIAISHQEVVLSSDTFIQELIDEARCHMSILFKICEAIAMLDMLSAFAYLVTTQDYVKPIITDTLALDDARHPIREKIMQTKFVPNDVYATQQRRFQIITGCNMSGKSTYIRSVALLSIMAQIGSFVPARRASFPILNQIFARVGMDDSIDSSVSTFSAEMREIAFILRNIDRQSMAIIDELGRGTSTRDGLAIAIAIAEALVDSRALVWFATHFKDISTILKERNGVTNLHLAVQISGNDNMTMSYKAVHGAVEEAHYGLALAGVVPLPPQVLADATHFAHKLERRLRRKKKTSAIVIQERRRRLLLNLKEHLVQAYNGVMEGETLANWLKELQREFINRMAIIEADAKNVADSEEEDEDIDMDGESDGDVEMSDRSVVDVEELEERASSVISIDSRITSTSSASTVHPPSTTVSSVRAVSENER
ncbi:DNA mismatch repair protein MutS [Massarina eburnea CBS 473.64]|uniref:DNA mismatch repair protein MSH3 n=1 Tax=Massarina eburnea CBS 473.64 TaxID=1395130 RepID=A0A6A6SGX1_9PLEO|nr:DNA mismatch repair protein MutS [Massarina eburnea CBS 473.64]